MKLDLEKFNPKKAELTHLSMTYEKLEIKWIDDKAWYNAVDIARKDLKANRIEIKKTWKIMRDEANAFNKQVLDYEKDLVSIIEPLEKTLLDKQNEIDALREIEKRKKLLPERRTLLSHIKYEMSDEAILQYDSEDFQSFYNQKHTEFLDEKQKRLDELEAENQRIKQENINKIETQRKNILDPYNPWNISHIKLWEISEDDFQEILESTKYNFEDKKKTARLLVEKEEKMRLDKIEKDKREAIKIAKQKAEEKSEKEKKELEEKHQAELEKIKKEKQEKIEKEKQQEQENKDKQMRLEKEQKYKKFVEKNEWQFDWFFDKDWKRTLYKIVDEFTFED